MNSAEPGRPVSAICLKVRPPEVAANLAMAVAKLVDELLPDTRHGTCHSLDGSLYAGVSSVGLPGMFVKPPSRLMSTRSTSRPAARTVRYPQVISVF